MCHRERIASLIRQIDAEVKRAARDVRGDLFEPQHRHNLGRLLIGLDAWADEAREVLGDVDQAIAQNRRAATLEEEYSR
jgi:hypothetical protein